ncbi:MAG: DinB family protein [Saprospiraceae bacterium]|nr:DinB family protein [Saprospiraceae bacterium]MBK8450197.1 DinB family protein [Saprospiraceae bacterium]MBK9221162.1 DinB family protein [Saprospiraceae bacterium]
MNFDLERTIELLERTPGILESFLKDLSTFWTNPNEGPETWSATDVLGHFVHAEKTNWIQRIEVILNFNGEGTFANFDRLAQFENCKGKSNNQLLGEFKLERLKNINALRAMQLTQFDLEKKGIHPSFGHVTLHQLLSTWVVHDLDHICQISRVMAKHFKEDTGPWIEYLRILKS